MTDPVKTPAAADKNWFIRFLDWALTDNWRDAWKWLSIYGYAIVIVSPEVFQLLTDLMSQLDGTQAAAIILPAKFVAFLRTVGTVGLVVRMIRQTKQKIDDAAATLAAAAAAAEEAKKAVAVVADAVADAQVAQTEAPKA